jgi:hypothetical protein
MTYRVDVTERNGRAFIERMFNSRPFDKNNIHETAVYGVAISGSKALERNVNQNEKWLALVDDRLLSVAYQTRTNYGAWQGGASEGGVLCLVDYVHGLAFESLYLSLASELGETSEEAILIIQCDAKQVYSARLLYHGPNGLAYWESLKTWKGGE